MDIIKKEQFIKMIAKKIGMDYNTVRKVYNAIENEVKDLLSKADEKQDIYIKIFTGIALHSKFIPEKEQKNNLTGKIITTKNKIKVKADITKEYCEKLI
ncbi:MAG: HU family DNA-binding protein [Lachnospiraceae bacterium]|nr:HU family DNA-binding protein [Lachnospiraceae bacterium]